MVSGIRYPEKNLYVYQESDYRLPDWSEKAVVRWQRRLYPRGMHVAVRESPLDVAAMYSRVADERAGAIVVFTGVVRDHSADHEGVSHLEYEAFMDRVEAALLAVGEEAAARWETCAVAIEHRIGRCAVGEPTVVVAVSAPHRGDAFEAARYCIDELKARAPIWKKEFWPGGEEWSPGA